MLIKTLKGTQEGNILVIGTISFLIVREWSANSNVDPRRDLRNKITKNDSTGGHPLALELYGYKEFDKNWVLSENHLSGWSEGRALNAIDTDKKTRLKRDVFIERAKEMYETALQEEIRMVCG